MVDPAFGGVIAQRMLFREARGFGLSMETLLDYEKSLSEASKVLKGTQKCQSEAASGVKTGQNGGKTGTPAFRCKKCRRIVALPKKSLLSPYFYRKRKEMEI
ncbi:hypothetical protein ACE6H2_023243 [Prunus campanulata]